MGAITQLWTRHEDRIHEAARRRADRDHETELRRLDHEHELLRDRLADRRTVRDRRVDRIYKNLSTILEGVLALGELVDHLRRKPLDYRNDSPEVDKALATITIERTALLIDEETTALFNRLGQALTAHRVWWQSIEVWEMAQQAQTNDLPDLTKDRIKTGDKLANLLLDIIGEAREALAKAEAPVD